MRRHSDNKRPIREMRDPASLIRERDAAKRWSKSVRTLQRWRKTGYGPPFLVIGRSVFYRLEDILAFEARQRRGGDQA